MNIPETLRVLLSIGVPPVVVPLHCITVPFSPTVALNDRVEAISATVVPCIVMGLAIFVRVATKSMLSHCGAERSLQSILSPVDAVARNWI